LKIRRSWRKRDREAVSSHNEPLGIDETPDRGAGGSGLRVVSEIEDRGGKGDREAVPERIKGLITTTAPRSMRLRRRGFWVNGSEVEDPEIRRGKGKRYSP